MSKVTFQWLLSLLLFLLPAQIGKHFWPDASRVLGMRIDYLAPTIYLTDIILGVLFVLWFAKKPFPLRRIKGNIKWLLLAVLLIFNILQSARPLTALIKAVTIVKLILLAGFVKDIKPNIRQVNIALIGAGIFSALLAWAQFFNQGSIGGIFWWIGERTFSPSTPGIAMVAVNGAYWLRPYATFPHPNVLAGFLVALTPLLLLPMKRPFLRITVLSFTALAFFMATLVILFSRSAWIIFLALFIICIFIRLRRDRGISVRSAIKRHGFLIVLLAGFLIIVQPLVRERFVTLTTTDRETVSRRVILNAAALAMVRQHPITGVGLGQFLSELPNHYRVRTLLDLQPAHNIYLLLAAETGLIGVASAAWFFIVLVRRFRQNHSIQKTTFFLSLSALMVLGLVDHYPYTIHQIQLFIAVLVGLLL